MAKHRSSRWRRSWGQRLVIVTGALSALVLAATAGGLGYLYRKVDRLPRIELSGVLASPDDAGQAKNYLIVGIDDATGLDADDPVWNDREAQMLSDTIMVLRVDPAERKAALLSLPRDLWVSYPDGDEARINTAIQRGNGRPDVLIQVLDDYLGIPIHHYVQLNFAGFRDLVDAIDGVPIYFPQPARDRNSGLSVLDTGCVTLDPVQALAYTRSRHYQELIDDEWTSDPTGDLGRIGRQQAFIRAALDRAVSRGARNPGTLDRLLDVALDSVTVDDDLTTGDIFDLAQRFRSFDPTSLETFAVPVEDDTTSAGAQIVRLVESEAEPTLALFRGDDTSSDTTSGENGTTTETVAPESVSLTVSNGSGVSGQAREAADELADAGFDVVGTGEADSFDYAETTIRYPTGSRAQAETVESWLATGAALEETPTPAADESTPIQVITGTNWTGVAAQPRPPESTTTTTDGNDTTDRGDTTSSTTEGTNPSDDSTTTTSLPQAC